VSGRSRCHFRATGFSPPIRYNPAAHRLCVLWDLGIRSHGHCPLVGTFRHHTPLGRRSCHVVHVWLLAEGVGLRGVGRASGCELRARVQSQRLRTIWIRVHGRPRRAGKAVGYRLGEGGLPRRGGSRVESLWLSVWLALWAKRLWKVLWLGLALRLLWSLVVSWVLAVAVRHGAIVLIRRVHGPLLSGTGALTRIVLRVRATIVAIDRLAQGRGALHHIGGLARHCGSSVGHAHVRLRGHGLRAAGHLGTGTEDVGEGGFPCARGLPVVGTARILWTLLVPVVGHVSSRSLARSGLCAAGR
jgi:hypothetical protein